MEDVGDFRLLIDSRFVINQLPFVIYGILSFATSDQALARAPLEQGLLGGQAALGIFQLQGLSGRSVRAPAGPVCLARRTRGLGNEVTFLQVSSVLLIVLTGMSRDRRTPTRMSETYLSHWHDSTSSGPTTGRVGWQHRPQDLASSNPSPHGPLEVLRQNLAMAANHQLLHQP